MATASRSAGKAAKPTKMTLPEADPPAPAKAEGVPMLRLKDLLTEAAARTGARKAEIKAAIEAALQILAETLDRGGSVNLPPLGRIRVGKVKEAAKGNLLTLKLKRAGGATAGVRASAPLADSADQG